MSIISMVFERAAAIREIGAAHVNVHAEDKGVWVRFPEAALAAPLISATNNKQAFHCFRRDMARV